MTSMDSHLNNLLDASKAYDRVKSLDFVQKITQRLIHTLVV